MNNQYQSNSSSHLTENLTSEQSQARASAESIKRLESTVEALSKTVSTLKAEFDRSHREVRRLTNTVSQLESQIRSRR